ncbi:885_t:CDS:2, partial [Cetraspora pellucida]
MEIKQKGSRSCRTDQGNVTNPEQHFLQDPASKIFADNSTSSPPPTANGGLLPEIPFDQKLKETPTKRWLSTSSKSYDVKVPRPNIFIIHHRTKSKELTERSAKASDFESKDDQSHELMPPADNPVTSNFSSTMNEPNFTNLENQFFSNKNGMSLQFKPLLR